MIATISTEKFLGHVGTVGSLFLFCLSLSVFASPVDAATIYTDGDNINLATGRTNTFSSSGSLYGNSVLTGPVRPSYQNLRFDAANSVDGPYWQVNFPTAYEVSNVSVLTYTPGYQINTMNVQTTTDGVNWTTQATPNVDGNNFLNATFAPVSGVLGVRLVSTNWDDNAYPAIFNQIRITGPNANLPLFLNGQSEFSVASALWNGGAVQSAPGWGPYGAGPTTIEPIDDATTGNFTYSKIIYSTSAANPAPIDLLLSDNYFIDTVAITTGNELGATGRTATHVDISYSSDETGSFTTILTNVELLGSPTNDNHYVVDLGGIYDARRLRFDFSHPNSSAADTFIAELYAYAAFVPPPAPEPSSMMLLACGLGFLAMKRRRQA